MHPWLIRCGTALAALAMSYSITAWRAVRRQIRPPRVAMSDAPPVTVLKPLCGAEPTTYECLRSFCEQDYSRFQIVFGVRDTGIGIAMAGPTIASDAPLT